MVKYRVRRYVRLANRLRFLHSRSGEANVLIGRYLALPSLPLGHPLLSFQAC
jgi:hypothetical protein